MCIAILQWLFIVLSSIFIVVPLYTPGDVTMLQLSLITFLWHMHTHEDTKFIACNNRSVHLSICLSVPLHDYNTKCYCISYINQTLCPMYCVVTMLAINYVYCTRTCISGAYVIFKLYMWFNNNDLSVLIALIINSAML